MKYVTFYLMLNSISTVKIYGIQVALITNNSGCLASF
jgi:hypothetical protein